MRKPWQRRSQGADSERDEFTEELDALTKEFDVVELPDGSVEVLEAMPAFYYAMMAEGKLRGVDMHNDRELYAFVAGVQAALRGWSQEAIDVALEMKKRSKGH